MIYETIVGKERLTLDTGNNPITRTGLKILTSYGLTVGESRTIIDGRGRIYTLSKQSHKAYSASYKNGSVVTDKTYKQAIAALLVFCETK